MAPLTVRTPPRGGRAAVRNAYAGHNTGRLVALVFVLAGLFAMHGLAGHGAHAGHEVMAAASSQTVLGHGQQFDTHSPTPAALPATEPAPDGRAQIDRASLPGTASGALMALCLAVLTGALLAFLAVRGQATVAVVVRPVSLGQARHAFGDRDRSPPSLAAFSVQRC